MVLAVIMYYITIIIIYVQYYSVFSIIHLHGTASVILYVLLMTNMVAFLGL